MHPIESLMRQQEALINQLRDEATKLRNEARDMFDMLSAIVEHSDEDRLSDLEFRAFAKTNAQDAMNACTIPAVHRRHGWIERDHTMSIWIEMPTPMPRFTDGDEFMIFTKESGTIHCRYRAANLDNGAAMFVSIRCDSWENQTEIPPSEVLCFIPCNPPVIQNTQDEKS